MFRFPGSEKSVSQDNKIIAIMIKELLMSTFKNTRKISELPEDYRDSWELNG